jgi:hypothetical protein
MSKDDWAALTLPTYERTVWSPKVAGGFHGVRLWVPEQLSLRETKGRLPVFGTVQVPREALKALAGIDGHPLRAVVVGGILGGVNQPAVGNAVREAPLFPLPDAAAVVEYFGVDLFECTGLARSVGRLFVFASLGPSVTEPVAVEVSA